MQKLVEQDGSGMVTIPIEFLRRDGIVENGEFPEHQSVDVSRLDERVYAVRLPADGELPRLSESEEIQKLAAQHLVETGQFQVTAD